MMTAYFAGEHRTKLFPATTVFCTIATKKKKKKESLLQLVPASSASPPTLGRWRKLKRPPALTEVRGALRQRTRCSVLVLSSFWARGDRDAGGGRKRNDWTTKESDLAMLPAAVSRTATPCLHPSENPYRPIYLARDEDRTRPSTLADDDAY
jgi:hypothetical protein